MKITIERDDAGNLTLDSRGVGAAIAEQMLMGTLTGLQRELLARRVMELRDERRLRERVLRGETS